MLYDDYMKLFLEGYDFFLNSRYKKIEKLPMLIVEDEKTKLKTKLKEEYDKLKLIADDEKTRNKLKNYCAILVSKQSFAIILKFMCGIYCYGNDDVIDSYHKLFSEIEIKDNYTLENLWEDFFFRYKNEYMAKWGVKSNAYEIEPPFLMKPLAQAVYSGIYGIDLKLEEISQSDVDIIANRILSMSNNKDDNSCDCHISAFLPIIYYSSLVKKWDIFEYTMKRYVLQAYINMDWNDDRNLGNKIEKILLNTYIDYIIDYKAQFVYDVFSWDDKINILDTSSYFLVKVKKGFLNAGEFAHILMQVFEKSKRYLQKYCDTKRYSDFCANVIYYLYFSGLNKETVLFLVNNYNELSLDDKNNPRMQHILIRSVLEEKQYENANILYGYYLYEADKANREIKQLNKEILAYVDCIDEVKKYLQDNNDCFAREYDIIFSNGYIEWICNNIRNGNIADANEKYMNSLEELFNVITEFSSDEIYEYRLPGADSDRESKFDFLIEYDLHNRIKGYRDNIKYLKHMIKDLKVYKERRLISFKLQNHLHTLFEENLKQVIEEISQIKKEYSSNNDTDTDNDRYTDIVGSASLNAALSQMDEIVDRFSEMLYSGYNGYSECENIVNRLQADFIRHIYKGLDGDLSSELSIDLLGKLPIDLQNQVMRCCVTSEVVYNTLINKADKEKMDYSSAIISLTKALEIVLGYIFQKMDVEYCDDLNPLAKSMFFNNKKIKKHIELGTYILMLEDYDEAVYCDDNSLNLSKPYDKPHFDKWNIDKLNHKSVLDMSKLASLDYLFPFSYNEETNTVNYVKMKEADDVYNRHVLSSAIRYIKNRYRNPSAHNKFMNINMAEDCKNLMIESQNILWVLLLCLNKE